MFCPDLSCCTKAGSAGGQQGEHVRAAERIPNLDALKAELKQYHDCTCKCGATPKTWTIRRIGPSRFCAPGGKSQFQEKLALVWTSTRPPLQLRGDGEGRIRVHSAVFNSWVESAKLQHSGTLRIYKEAQRLGVSVFFITGDRDRAQGYEQNLRAQA